MSVLVVDRVTIKRGVRVVIDARSLTVEAGEIVGLVGANGCGKSTLLSCIAGVLPPHDGRIEVRVEARPDSVAGASVAGASVAGASVWGSSKQRAKARRAMGYVPEGADPPGFLRAEELWALCASSRGVSLPTRERDNLDERRARSSADGDAKVFAALDLDEVASLTLDKMSLGQRRRACLGAALLGPPALLVLDEPDNGLDVKRLAALADLLAAHAAGGGATILASHDVAWLDELDARRIEM